MADGDAGSALMFIKGAERNFGVIEKLTDDLIMQSSESKDLRNRARRDQDSSDSN